VPCSESLKKRLSMGLERESIGGANAARRLRVASIAATHDFASVRVIDAHVHLYPTETNRDPAGWAAAEGEPHWATLCTRRRANGRAVQGFPEVDELLVAMDAAQVDHAVLLSWYWQTPASVLDQNRFFAGVVKQHPDRFSACAGWHPALAEAPMDYVRRLGDDGFVGMGELSPHSIGLSSKDPAWHALLAAAGEAGLPVNLHVTDPSSRPYPGRIETPLADFVTWAKQFPDTILVLAHGGGGLPRVSPEEAKLPNLYYDTAAFPLLYPETDLSWWAALVGGERLLWGTDIPIDLFPRGAPGEGWSRCRAEAERGLTDARVLRGVMGQNAASVFNLRLT
jgi:uncharacterized protein